MTKAEIIDYLYANNVRGDLTIEQMADDLADRKTENSSEKPNNCDYAENPSGDVWACGCFLDTYCEHQIYDRNLDGTINIVECGYEPKDEPQTETEMERLERIDNEIEDAWARIRELTDEPQTK